MIPKLPTENSDVLKPVRVEEKDLRGAFFSLPVQMRNDEMGRPVGAEMKADEIASPPWRIVMVMGSIPHVVADDGSWVVEPSASRLADPRTEPNARLIAAAPDLLAAAREVLRHEVGDYSRAELTGGRARAVEALRAAIKKSEERDRTP